MPALRILYDGWSFRYAPDSPASLHLLAILSILPPDIEAVLALPDSVPGWVETLQLPIQVEISAKASTPFGLLAWQQHRLNRIARQQGAHLIHIPQAAAPILGSLKVLVSPASYEFTYPRIFSRAPSSLMDRLRSSLAYGSASQAGLLWPEDLPAPDPKLIRAKLPPLVMPDFNDAGDLQGLDLPDTFVLFHGPNDHQTLKTLLEAWSWVVKPLGDQFPLLLLGMHAGGRQRVNQLLQATSLGSSVRLLPELSPVAVPSLYWRAALVVHPAPEPPWGGPVRQALICRRPVVAVEYPSVAKLVGASAYLSPAHNTRALGAAMITVLVEEPLAEKLSAAAQVRSQNWSTINYSQAIRNLYYQTASL